MQSAPSPPLTCEGLAQLGRHIALAGRDQGLLPQQPHQQQVQEGGLAGRAGLGLPAAGQRVGVRLGQLHPAVQDEGVTAGCGAREGGEGGGERQQLGACRRHGLAWRWAPHRPPCIPPAAHQVFQAGASSARLRRPSRAGAPPLSPMHSPSCSPGLPGGRILIQAVCQALQRGDGGLGRQHAAPHRVGHAVGAGPPTRTAHACSDAPRPQPCSDHAAGPAQHMGHVSATCASTLAIPGYAWSVPSMRSLQHMPPAWQYLAGTNAAP